MKHYGNFVLAPVRRGLAVSVEELAEAVAAATNPPVDRTYVAESVNWPRPNKSASHHHSKQKRQRSLRARGFR